MLSNLKVLESQPEEFFRQTGNIFIKRMYLEKRGYSCFGHSHKHDHISLLAHGAVSMNGKVFKAPYFIDVPSGTHHQFIALEDETVLYCVHDTKGLEVEDLGESF